MPTYDYRLYPDYPRIPHLAGVGSRLSGDDTEAASSASGPCWVQEKVDGANFGVCWDADGPVLRNRSKILNKSYAGARTPAKRQFAPAWGWAYEHEEAIRGVSAAYGGPLTIYGEWLWAEHSMPYDRLPDWFVAYDLWDGHSGRFLAPDRANALMEGSGIAWIAAAPIQPSSPAALKAALEAPSRYRDGIREGIVLKWAEADARWRGQTLKIVRGDFERTDDDWNKRELVRNRKAKP